MRFMLGAALRIERFAFPIERRRYSLSEMSSFFQKVIEMPQKISDHSRPQRIHGKASLGNAIGTPN